MERGTEMEFENLQGLHHEELISYIIELGPYHESQEAIEEFKPESYMIKLFTS